MLTRLRVRGFKNLLDVDLPLGPFTCVAGPNAAGKSNLFDAIRFLHLLTRHPIMEAVRRLRETRGRSPEPRSLFTSFGDFRAPEIRLAAEMIMPRDVEDDFGVCATAAISTVVYEVAFRLDEGADVERLELVEEWLRPVKASEARRGAGAWAGEPFQASCISGRRGRDFVSTSQAPGGVPQIRIHQEGHGGRRVPAQKSSRTVVGGSASSDFPSLLAAYREMASWRTLLLEPSAMRAPSRYSDLRQIDARGANLPGAITRLQRAAGGDALCAELANRLAGLVEDIRSLRIRDDEGTESLTLEAAGGDGVYHPARSLSDGTLRFLVLAVLSLDPDSRGTICLEEPENGIHPERIGAMVQLLKDVSVDAEHAVGDDNPLRQVVINTHSPVVVEHVDPCADLVYLEEARTPGGNATGRVALPRYPAGSWRCAADGRPAEVLAPGRLRPYFRVAELPAQLRLFDEETDG